MADLGKSRSETLVPRKDAGWIVATFRELTPQVRNLGVRSSVEGCSGFGRSRMACSPAWTPSPDFAVNAFPGGAGPQGTQRGYWLHAQLAVWDEDECRRVVIDSQATRQVDRPQASGARRKPVRMLTELDDTLVADMAEEGR